MTTVLLAIDDTDESHDAAIEARALFGDDAEYLAVHVDAAPTPSGDVAWGAVYGYPYPVVPSQDLRDPEAREAAVVEARAQAAELVDEIGVPAEPVGEVGDPASAIARAAVEHDADVVVVGWHHRGWFRHLFEGSVTDALFEIASRPVLVVPSREDD